MTEVSDRMIDGESSRSLEKPPPAITLDEALDQNPVGFFQWRILLMCGFAFMADALEVNLLIFLSTCTGDEWGLDDQQQASITGIVFAGIIAGSIFWGIFADRYGRKPAFLWSCACISVGGFLSGAAPSYEWLIIFRLICGIGIGGANIPFDLLAEFLPASHRGQFLIYIEYFWCAGSLFVTGVAWICLSSEGWRFLAFIVAIPVTVTNVFSIFYLPESPSWLLMKGRSAEAAKVIRDAAELNGITMAPFTLKTEDLGACQSEEASYSELLTIKEVRKITLPLWLVWFAFGFTYYGLILFVGRIYADKSDDDGNNEKTCTFDYESIFINATAEVAGITLTALIIDKLGRINTQICLYLASAVTVFAMGFEMSVDALLVVSLLGRMFIMSASNATWVTTPELFHTNTRTVGHASSVSWSKFGAFISPYVVVSAIPYEYLGIILGAVNILAAFASYLLPETSGKYLENEATASRQASLADHSTHSAVVLLNNDKNGSHSRQVSAESTDSGSQLDDVVITSSGADDNVHYHNGHNHTGSGNDASERERVSSGAEVAGTGDVSLQEPSAWTVNELHSSNV